MILDALTSQINQRFQHEKRAQVCLWFDPSREFSRLLPSFERHLDQMSEAAFTLLRYDAKALHGQVWLKHQVYCELSGLNDAERKQKRFLIYLPLSEDRLDTPDERGDHHLGLLEEYRTAGLVWRVGGKRPSLFRFLRQAGVRLPGSSSDQRKLYDGGFESLLAKYVAKFADRPAVYWETQLTPDIAQERLLGDVDQTIIEIAIEPEATWGDLQEKGLAPELLSKVSDRYGFTHPTDPPDAWIRSFVALVALTETHKGYDDAEDFPFVDRLPPLTLRSHYTELLQRWLRDSEGRSAWDHWVREVETEIDLSAWATERDGLSFAFPHIVRLRWEVVLEKLRTSATKTSSTEHFFGEHIQQIKLEAEYSRASERPIGAWPLLLALGGFIEACRLAEHDISGATSASGLASVFVDNAARVDQQHLTLRRQAEELGLPSVATIADRHYASYTNTLNGRFFKDYAKQDNADIAGVPGVTKKLEHCIWGAKGRRAIVIVDALRFDCGLAIRDQLRGHDVVVEPMRADLPTITPIGMTALMPISSATLKLDIKGNTVHPLVNGKDCSGRKQRLEFMTSQGADCRDIEDLESMSAGPDTLGELLVVFGHDQVDHIGHGSAGNLVRHVDLEVQRIARLVRKLHRWGYETVHVVTDHGFILLEESKLPEEVACEKDWCHVRKERFALVPSTADIPLASFPTAWDSSVRVAVPPGLAFFKAEKSFSHGGAALQELIIPHLVSKSQAQQGKPIGVEVVLPTHKLIQTFVKVILRPVQESKSTQGELALFNKTGRTLTLDVCRTKDPSSTILATPKAKEVRLEVGDAEKKVTLFFHTAKSFEEGELLDLDIRDVDTDEQFPPGGIKLSVGRKM